MIDYRTSKEEAYRLIQQASAIFLCVCVADRL